MSDSAVWPMSEAPRAVLVTHPEDLPALESMVVDGTPIVAVMTVPSLYEYVRSFLPRDVRCAVHPNELRTIGITEAEALPHSRAPSARARPSSGQSLGG